MSYGFGVSSNSDQQVGSTGTGDVKTVTPPGNATGMMIGVETTDARVAFGGGAPASTLGQLLKAGLQPVFYPFAKPFKFASSAAAVSTLNITWLF